MPIVKLRPTVAVWVPRDQSGQSFLNAAGAIDSDADPPTTYAEHHARRYSSLSDNGYLDLTGFEPPPGAVNELTLHALIESGAVDTGDEHFGWSSIHRSLDGGSNWETTFTGLGDLTLEDHPEILSGEQDISQVRVRTDEGHSLFWNAPEGGYDFIRTYDVYLEADFTPDAFPVRPDYPIPRTLVDAKIRTPLQSGNVHIRSDAPALVTLELHGEAGYDELDAFLAFYESLAETAFYFADEAFDPIVYRLVKFTGPPTWMENNSDTVVWQCTLQEVPA